MKAIVCTRYGSPDVLQLREVDRPVPGDKEVLIAVRATTVTAADGMMRRGTPLYGRFFIGLTKPRKPIPGTGVAGEVVAVGKGVERFREGDRVFGETGVGFGAHAEYVSVPEDGVLAEMTAGMDYEEAATLCDGALTSWCFLRKVGDVRAGQRVLVNGASGGLGTSAVQLAKHIGAHVTGVCSTPNLDLVRSLGADEVVDYTRTDFTKSGQAYDVIFDTVGKCSFPRCRSALTPDGVYLSPVLGVPLLLQMLCTSRFGGRKARFSATGLRPPAELRPLVEELKELVSAGRMKTVIDRRFPLEQIPEAHRYVDRGHKKGNVVIRVGPESRDRSSE